MDCRKMIKKIGVYRMNSKWRKKAGGIRNKRRDKLKGMEEVRIQSEGETYFWLKVC